VNALQLDADDFTPVLQELILPPLHCACHKLFFSQVAIKILTAPLYSATPIS